MKERCPWAGNDPLYLEYHDREWGVPVHDDRKLFEFLVLEGAQAGLSWITVLRKRENYRKAFENFDPEKIASFGHKKVEELLLHEGLIRNRRKIESVIDNAEAFLRVREEFSGFSNYMWSFVEGIPIQNCWKEMGEVPPYTPLAEKLSKDLKKRGFTFVGPTIIYSHMQAIGMVNDHLVSCFRHRELGGSNFRS